MFLGIVCVVLAIFTVFGNSLILHALRTCQTLHAPTKALLCSLAFSDLGVGIVVYPLFAVYCFTVVFNNSEAFCSIHDSYAIAAYCLGSVSFLTMTAIAIDRLYAFTQIKVSSVRYLQASCVSSRCVLDIWIDLAFLIPTKPYNNHECSRCDNFLLCCDYFDIIHQSDYWNT